MKQRFPDASARVNPPPGADLTATGTLPQVPPKIRAIQATR
jgi:hypothetical protein